jgi:uncharacterized protein YkwD
MMRLRASARAAALAAAFLGGLVACAPPRETMRADPGGLYGRLDSPGTRFEEAAAISLVNAYRARHGLSALAADDALSATARERATRAGREDRSVFGEVPDLTGPAGTGLRLSAGYLTTAEAFSGWRDVPAHERAMLDPAARRIGIAAVHVPGSKYRVYWAVATGR